MPEQLQDNPIYKFMKANNLTKLDEKGFIDKYSTPEKAKEIHGFMLANKLTDLDETKFYDKYLSSGLKKKEQEVSQYDYSPTKSPSASPDFEKGKAFAEKGFLMKGEGTKEQKRISLEPSLLGGAFGGAPEVKILEEKEEPSALAEISGAVAKGTLQGKVANILSAGKRPTEDELGEIAQLQSDAQLFPQSKSEKLYQEKGLKGLFKDNPLLGAQFIAETMASSLSSLIVASSKTVPAAALAGAAVGAPTGVGALVGAGYGLLAGQSAAGYNLSTSQDILNSLSENGVDVSNKESLIKAFSDENKMAKIRNTAAKYGIPILIFDAATAGLAGKIATGAVGKGLAKKLLAGLGETGIQIGGGMGGEFTAQLASGKKVNWDDVIVEGLAEVPGGASEVATGIAIERSKSSSNNKTLATQIATQGVQNGSEDAIVNLNRDLSNNVITPEQHQEGVDFVQKASQVAEKIPENVTGDNKVKSIELLVERNDIKDNNQNLIQQKQTSDEAYHAGIDEEIKANEEKIKKIDSEVYDISKKPSTGGKKYVVDGKEISQEEFDALQDKPIGTKEIITAEVKPEEVIVTEEIKPTEEVLTKRQLDNRERSRIEDVVDRVEQGDIKASNISVADKDLTEYFIDKGLDGREAYIVKDTIERLIKPLQRITDKIDTQEVKFFTENVEDITSVVEGLEDARTTLFFRNKDVVDNVNKEAKRLLDYYSDKNNLPENKLDNENTFAATVDLLEKFLNGDVNYLDLTKFGIQKQLKDYYKLKVKAEVKPTEVKEKAITKSKFKKPINQELLETIPEKNISDVVEKIDNGKAELNVDVFPATDLGTDNKITNNQIVYLLHSQGKEIGVLTVNNETLGNRSESSIAGVVLHPDVKGKGIGKEIYRFVNNDLINKGRKPLKSDFDITPDAINVWKSLVKSGEAREVGVAKNGKPLFEMNKPTEEEVKIKNITPENIEDKLKYIEFEVTDNDNAGVKDIHHGSDVYKTGSTIVRNDIKYPTYVILGRNESNYFEFIINDKGEVEPLHKDVVKVNQLSKNEIDVKDTAKKLQDIADSRQPRGKIDEKTYQLYNDVEKIVGRFDYTKNKWEDVAKFYHKALKDGSNPELVKMVGDYLEGSYTPKEPKVYNAKDLKKNPEILKEDEDANTITYPRSFVRLATNMLALKSAGHENAKIGDVINIFKKDYVIESFLENKKNPNETKIGLIRVDKDGNILRERDLSKKEQKEGKAKEFEEEEEIEVEEAEELTKDDLKKAEAKFAAAKDRFEKAKAKVEASQVTQRGMFGGEQKGMFAMGGEEAKSTLDPLRKAAKEAKAELDDIRNRIKVQEVAQPELKAIEEETPYQKALKEKQEADKKQNRQIGAEKAAATKEIFRKVKQTDSQVGTGKEGAQEIALRYLADGGIVSSAAVDESYGSVKKAELNTGRREVKSSEVKSKDFVGGNETLKKLAHRLWEVNKQRVSERDIKDALMAEIGNNNTRLEAAEAYLEQYSPEYKQEKEEMRMAEQYKEEYLEEQEKLEKELREPLSEQIEGEASEEHINNLIDQYEAEIKGEDQQFGPASEGEVNKEASKGKVSEKTREAELAKEFKEATKKAGKKAKENAKKDYVDRNFEYIKEKIKIEKKCPT